MSFGFFNPFINKNIPNGRKKVVKFASKAPRESIICQGEIVSINADTKASLLFLNSSFTNKIVAKIAKTPNSALGSLVENSFRPKKVTEGIAR